MWSNSGWTQSTTPSGNTGSAPSTDRVDYITEETFDQMIQCKYPRFRDPVCNHDFNHCTKVLPIYNYYQISYGIGGLAGNLTGLSDAERQQKLQSQAAALMQQANQDGQDINVASFDIIDGKAKNDLVWLNAKKLLHISTITRLAFLLNNWPTGETALKSPSCNNDTSNEIKGTYSDTQCISNVNDYSGNDGCRTADTDMYDFDFFEGKEEDILNYIPEFGDSYAIDQNKHNISKKEYGSLTNKYRDLIKQQRGKVEESEEDIPQSNCNETGFKKFVEEQLNSKLWSFLKPYIAHTKCEYKIKKTVSGNYTTTPKTSGQYEVTVTACRHLCYTTFNFNNYVIPNLDQKNKVQAFLNQVQINLKDLNEKIAGMKGLRDELDRGKQAYLDALNNPDDDVADAGPTPSPIDCSKNPFLSGCYQRVDGGNYGAGGGQKWNGKKDVPGPDDISKGGTATGTTEAGGDLGDKAASAAGHGGAPAADGGAAGGGGGDMGGGSGGGAVAEEKKKEDEKTSVDLTGVSEYGNKKKKSSGASGYSNFDSGSKSKKSKNPFEDLFGDKNANKDGRSGIHLRDIASANEAEDEELGFSNVFSRISKTYIKKYYDGQVGNKNENKK